MNNAVRYCGWSYHRDAARNWVIVDPHGASFTVDKSFTDREVRQLINNETALTGLEVSF